MSLLPGEVHASWSPFLTEEVLSLLADIETALAGQVINPTEAWRVLRFLKEDLDAVQVVWLGQDVYPAAGVATGRAFEVGGMTSWHKPFRQVSMKNIVRLLHKNYKGITEYGDIAPFKAIQEEMLYGDFPLLPPHQWFDSLSAQGVLFLNRTFTCRVGEPNSHLDIWTAFSDRVLRYIAERNPNIHWFLWGKEAISATSHIENGHIHTSRHPMMCSAKYADDFLRFDGFAHTWKKINWLG
jgi:uracil-DNA glycosylase